MGQASAEVLKLGSGMANGNIYLRDHKLGKEFILFLLYHLASIAKKDIGTISVSTQTTTNQY